MFLNPKVMPCCKQDGGALLATDMNVGRCRERVLPSCILHVCMYVYVRSSHSFVFLLLFLLFIVFVSSHLFDVFACLCVWLTL